MTEKEQSRIFVCGKYVLIIFAYFTCLNFYYLLTYSWSPYIRHIAWKQFFPYLHLLGKKETT